MPFSPQAPLFYPHIHKRLEKKKKDFDARDDASAPLGVNVLGTFLERVVCSRERELQKIGLSLLPCGRDDSQRFLRQSVSAVNIGAWIDLVVHGVTFRPIVPIDDSGGVGAGF